MLRTSFKSFPRAATASASAFEDGVEGVVDVSQLVPFEGVFAELRDPDKFGQVHVQPTWGTIALARQGGPGPRPCPVRTRITGKPIPSAK